MYECMIIGGGIAGLTAGIYAARAGLRTVIIEKEQCGGQALTADIVENYPGFLGSGYELAEKIETQAKNAGVKILYDDIESVNFDGSIKRIIGVNSIYEGKTVIAATGAGHRKAGFKGEDEFIGRGISYCAVCDGAFFEGKNVAVVGGGNTAVSEALYLSRFCGKVYIVYRKDKLKADFTLVKKLNAIKNIDIIYNTTVAEVKGNKSVSKIITDNGEFNVNGIFVAAGITPNTNLFSGVLELDENGYIIVKDGLKTSCERVFAAGDCRIKTLRQMITAAADGAEAASEAFRLIEE